MTHFSLEYGIAGVCVLLTIQILIKLGSYFFRVWEKKEAVSVETIQQLLFKVKMLELTVVEIPKLKLDLKRAFVAIKRLSGEKWPEIRKEIMEDDL